MSYDSPYAWVVVCKNRKFHNRKNVFFGHKIPLAETDAFSPPPTLAEGFPVCCDECGQEYSYRLKELVRIELDLPDGFTPHPFFV
jgi:hypothetical protein